MVVYTLVVVSILLGFYRQHQADFLPALFVNSALAVFLGWLFHLTRGKTALLLLKIHAGIRLALVPVFGFMMLFPGFLYAGTDDAMPMINYIFAFSAFVITPVLSAYFLKLDIKRFN